MRAKTLIWWIRKRAVMLLATAAIGSIALFITLFELTSLMPGANSYEVATRQSIEIFFSEPLNAIINAPYTLLVRVIDVFVQPLTAQRSASAIAGLATVALLGYVLRQWFNNRIAIAGTLFIVTTSWYLHLARTGAPFVMAALWLSLILALGTWRTYTTKPFLVDMLLVIFAALSLYTPYFLWVIGIGLFVLAIRRKKQFFLLPRRHQIILPLVFVLIVSPLIAAIVVEPALARQLAGIEALPPTFFEFIRQIGQNVSQIFFRGFINPALNLGRLPLLDIFSAVMVGLGILYFERQRDLRRSQLMFATIVLVGIVVSLSPFFIGQLAILFPLIMICAVAGIVELLTRWLKSFPRNPIARTIGVCVIVIAIGFTSHYHLQRYYVAWSSNPSAIGAHQNQL